MERKISKRARVAAFTRIFLGVVWDFWREARLTRRIGLSQAEQRMAPRHRKRATQFRETATRLGGVLIKLGQFIGSRVDVMPEPYIQELMKLQDEVPPEDYLAVKELLEAEFGRPIGEVYAVFNPVPQAAASLAQAHEAELLTGEKVVAKVQRPGIEKLIDIDLATFTYLMEGVRRFTKVGERFDIAGLYTSSSESWEKSWIFYAKPITPSSSQRTSGETHMSVCLRSTVSTRPAALLP